MNVKTLTKGPHRSDGWPLSDGGVNRPLASGGQGG